MDNKLLDPNTQFSEIDLIIERHGDQQNAVIPILLAIQKKYRYLPESALRRIVEKTNISPATITGVSTFYSRFRHEPMGENIIRVCTGTACHVKGAELVYEAFLRDLGIPTGKDTDPTQKFTIQKVACLGCCTLAPVIQIENTTYGHVTADQTQQILDDFISSKNKGVEIDDNMPDEISQKPLAEIRVGLGSCCVAGGSEKVKNSLEKSLSYFDIPVKVKSVGCVGMCHKTPLVEVKINDQKPALYSDVQPDEAIQLIQNYFKPRSFSKRIISGINKNIDRFLFDPLSELSHNKFDMRDEPVRAFLQNQIPIATELRGVIDPIDLEDYQKYNGFQALEKCLHELSTDQVLEEIQKSKLRGRGGAGFTTAEKWRLVKSASGTDKYIICNGDEGDPGAFMDRMLLESFPYRIIEGLLIAAYVVGASQGYFYIRAEYPLAVQRIEEAIAICKNAGLIGQNILGSEFSFSIKIIEGAGAFVCGEESALIRSIEGQRGMPRFRPPYPAQKGLWEKPTLVNNAETFSMVPWIMRNGGPAFSGFGTAKSKGTKVFSLAGKIARGGLIEVPMGTTIRQIVEEIGGGAANGKQFKAIQIGGPSGGCIPAELAHTRVDYEELLKVGAMMGSGGLLVMDETDCMVDIAKYFLAFTQDQSCGKCTFCRIGTKQMLEILQRICGGKGKKGDIEKLELLAHDVNKGSLCGLGKTAPNPVLTTLKYFRHEYEAHLNGKCPAKKCRDLINYSITDDCIGCTICAQKCPVEAIELLPYQKHQIDNEKCICCDTCLQVCPHSAVEVVS